MPTVNFDATTQAGCVWSPINSWTDSSNAGHDQRQVKSGVRLDLVATGTSATLAILSGPANSIAVTVDGSASTPTVAGGYTWTTATLFSGLSDGPHEVTVTFGSSETWVERGTNSETLQVTGSAPAVETAASLTAGSHPTQSAWLSALSGAQHRFYDYPGSCEAGSWASGSGSGFQAFSTTQNDATFRLRHAGAFSMFMYRGGGRLYCSVDGGAEAELDVPNSGDYNWVDFSAIAPDASEHEYRLTTGATPGTGQYLMAVRTDSGAGYNTSSALWPAPTAKDQVAFAGDSITFNGGTSPDSHLGYVHLLYLDAPSNRIFWNQGVSGSKVVGEWETDAYVARVTGISPAPVTCLVLLGVNDLSAATAAATFRASYWQLINKLTTGLSTTAFKVSGVFPASGLSTSAYNAAIQQVLGAAGDGAGHVLTSGQQARCTYIDPAPMQLNGASGTDYTTNYLDGLHPNAAGYAKVHDLFAPYLAAAAGPAAGPTLALLGCG